MTTPAEIDIEAIAWAVGAQVRYRDLESCEARIIGFNDRAIITVQQEGDWRRRRFSIAHELGHWQLHRGRSSICRANEIGGRSQNAVPAERAADTFGAELLMPAYLFYPLAAKHKRPSFEAIDALAQEFSTSRSATARRFVDLSPWPCMLVCHGPQGRRWFKRGEDIASHWFPQNDLDAESSAMTVLYGDAERTSPTIIGADAWFDRRGADSYTITEQSIKAFGGEVLTLLTIKDADMLV